MHGDAIGLGAGLELVAERERLGSARVIGGGPGVGVVVEPQLAGAVREQERRVRVEQRRLPVARLLPPRVEVPRRDDLGGDAGVVEGEQGVVVDEQPAPAGARFELLDLLAERLVVREELVVGLPVALDERVADEELPA